MRLTRSTTTCTHLPAESASPRSETCEACGSRYSLRSCAHCGFVGCCESQAGHNRDHALGAGHPVLHSMPLGRHSFTWCYECRRYVDTPDL